MADWKRWENLAKEYDPKGMLLIYREFPKQVKDACEKVVPQLGAIREKAEWAIVAGMGGSAISGDYLATLAERNGRNGKFVFVHRDYLLPKWACEEVKEEAVLLAISYSGNTEETLYAAEEAERRGIPIVAVSSGGKLETLAKEKKFPHIKIPAGFQPRAAFGYLATAAIAVGARLGILGEKTLEDLEKLPAKLEERREVVERLAEEIAIEAYGKLILIYGSRVTRAVAFRWKGQFNENSKTLAFVAEYPELNHNEIVGWESIPHMQKQTVIYQLRDKEEYYRVSKRMETTSRLIAKRTFKIVDIFAEGETLLERLFVLTWIGDLASVFLALLYGKDPADIGPISYLKEELARLK